MTKVAQEPEALKQPFCCFPKWRRRGKEKVEEGKDGKGDGDGNGEAEEGEKRKAAAKKSQFISIEQRKTNKESSFIH